MRQRVFSVGFRACLATLALLLAIPAVAQLPTTITISDPRGEVAELLHRGQQLEQQRRWGEALAHYEDAVRQYPKETALQQRFDNARLHYDLERRYADRSFCDLVARLSPERALESLRPSAAEDRIALRRRSALEGPGRSRRPRLCAGAWANRRSSIGTFRSATGWRSTPSAENCRA